MEPSDNVTISNCSSTTDCPPQCDPVQGVSIDTLLTHHCISCSKECTKRCSTCKTAYLHCSVYCQRQDRPAHVARSGPVVDGPVHIVTMPPIDGRMSGGGLRFRDPTDITLLSHKSATVQEGPDYSCMTVGGQEEECFRKWEDQPKSEEALAELLKRKAFKQIVILFS